MSLPLHRVDTLVMINSPQCVLFASEGETRHERRRPKGSEIGTALGR